MNLYILLFLLPLASIAQIGTPIKTPPSITVGKVTPMGTFGAELTYAPNPVDANGTLYTLKFRNYKYDQVTLTFVVQFSGVNHTVDSLYSLMKTVFAKENKKNKDYTVTVTLGKDVVTIGTYRVDMIGLKFSLPDGSYGVLTEKQLDKLFAKNL